MKKLILTTLLIVGVSAPQLAHAQETYTIDASHTNILLRVSHGGFSEMVLEALQPEGTIVFDKENPTKSAVQLTLKSSNIDGDDEKFNEHLHSADFFDAKNHPEITFKSTNIKMIDENTGIITGDLTLRGITKPVNLNVDFNKAGQNPSSKKDVIGFTASGSLNRSDYMMNYGLPFVGDKVTLDINVEATK